VPALPPPRRYVLTFARSPPPPPPSRLWRPRFWPLGAPRSASVVRAALEAGATPRDELRCFHHCLALLRHLDRSRGSSSRGGTDRGGRAGGLLVAAVAAARREADAEWPHFWAALQPPPGAGLGPPADAGWDLSRVTLGSGSWRCAFADTSAGQKDA
jgi:hypothetical protein